MKLFSSFCPNHHIKEIPSAAFCDIFYATMSRFSQLTAGKLVFLCHKNVEKKISLLHHKEKWKLESSIEKIMALQVDMLCDKNWI
jgi:hypothetical protein